MKPTFGRRHLAPLEPKRTKTAPARKTDASPAESLDWPTIRRYGRNSALALLIAAKLAIVAIHVIRLNASHSFAEYATPIALMAASAIVIVGGLWLAGMKLRGSD